LEATDDRQSGVSVSILLATVLATFRSHGRIGVADGGRQSVVEAPNVVPALTGRETLIQLLRRRQNVGSGGGEEVGDVQSRHRRTTSRLGTRSPQEIASRQCRDDVAVTLSVRFLQLTSSRSAILGCANVEVGCQSGTRLNGD
jgi:hypothetical protein